jgi:carnosine N-methyltransferase
MIITSNFILNDVQEANSFSIAPNIHSFCNVLTERELY